MKTKLIILAVFVSVMTTVSAETVSGADSKDISPRIRTSQTVNPEAAQKPSTESAKAPENAANLNSNIPAEPESASLQKRRPWKSEEALQRVSEFRDGKSAVNSGESSLSLQKRGDGSTGTAILRFSVSIIIMAAVLGAFYFFMKKFGRKLGGNTNPGTVRVIAKQYIDNKNFLVLVKVYEEEILLGVGNSGIQMLTKFAPIESGDEDDPVAESDRNAVNVSKNIRDQDDESVIKGVKELI